MCKWLNQPDKTDNFICSPDGLPEGESLDFRANDQLSGLTEAQCGSLNSTGTEKRKP